ncbi:aminotransferase class I/II-fold pyridoxal phosphate-dependent enzyme [Spirosoma spitsbergense]|uniref:aminotransferase class I/II-fold pyridoxal phosphate-dependent enzyme n=1 Tax=Spirosoma spitsbergense TaxID=431554 RepID=UPI000366E32C|nr:pyridoxal phosphate-dependent aminotransferase family protein [Spirosoma spitsbergense]
MSILEKLNRKKTGLTAYAQHENEYVYPKYERPLKSRINFKGNEVITRSFNDCLGLQSDERIIQAEVEYGSGYPGGSRLLTGNTAYHNKLEHGISQLIDKDVLLLNFGYQGIVSAVDSLVDRHDTIIYDQQVHTNLIDGVRLHQGPKFSYRHNDIYQLGKLLSKVQPSSEVLVLMDGVFSMRGDKANGTDILKLKETYDFTLLVDDTHGFVRFYEHGSVEELMPEIDIYISTFAKALATTGGFVAARKEFIDYFKYNLRSQTFSRTLPLLTVASVLFKLKLLAQEGDERRNKLWKNTRLLQEGLKAMGYDIGNTCSPIIPVYLTCSEKSAAAFLRELRYTHGVFCSPVVYPVVPKETMILRLTVTALHITQTLNAFAKLQQTFVLNSVRECSENQ